MPTFSPSLEGFGIIRFYGSQLSEQRWFEDTRSHKELATMFIRSPWYETRPIVACETRHIEVAA
jgi:hypothetical protein